MPLKSKIKRLFGNLARPGGGPLVCARERRPRSRVITGAGIKGIIFRNWDNRHKERSDVPRGYWRDIGLEDEHRRYGHNCLGGPMGDFRGPFTSEDIVRIVLNNMGRIERDTAI